MNYPPDLPGIDRYPDLLAQYRAAYRQAVRAGCGSGCEAGKVVAKYSNLLRRRQERDK